MASNISSPASPQVFITADGNGSGEIDAAELLALVEAYLPQEDSKETAASVEAMLKEADLKRQGTVDYSEFLFMVWEGRHRGHGRWVS